MNTNDSVDPDLPCLERLTRQTDFRRIAETTDGPPGPEEVFAWTFPLDADADEVESCGRILDVIETERASRFHFDKHRRRFILAHATMRQILASMLNRQPNDWTWCTTSRGKPYLPSDINPDNLRFNLSHSGETGFLAVRTQLEIGADIEQIRDLKDAVSLAKSYYSPAENEQLQKLVPAQHTDKFFRFWTRKEAFLKATGDGLAGGLSKYCTAGNPERNCGAVREPSQDRTLMWTFFDCPAPAGYRAAIVTDPPLRKITLYHLWRATS